MHDWGVMDWLTAIITVAVILGIVVLSNRRAMSVPQGGPLRVE